MPLLCHLLYNIGEMLLATLLPINRELIANAVIILFITGTARMFTFTFAETMSIANDPNAVIIMVITY